jgi:peroxiredoxin (alkyl hydroperoxide reductase subunit C)
VNDLSEKKRPLQVGDIAPDFSLPTHNEGELNLRWYRGRHNVVLVFYPGDWTPVCSVQIPEYREHISFFNDCNCQLLCVSVDSVPCHVAWAQTFGTLSFPLMSDFWPHGEVAKKYGVLSDKGYAERSVFLIDISGVIRFIERYDFEQIPETIDLFDQMAKLISQTATGRD